MANETTPPASRPEQAMNQVLEAERQAQQAIEHCTQEAAQLVDAARQQARHIAERTTMRIGKLHSRCAVGLGDEVEKMLRQEGDTDSGHPQEQDEHEVLAAAVVRLAVELTGTGTDDAAE